MYCIIGINGAWTIDRAVDHVTTSRDSERVWDELFAGDDSSTEQEKSDTGFRIAKKILKERPWSEDLYGVTTIGRIPAAPRSLYLKDIRCSCNSDLPACCSFFLLFNIDG